MFGGRNREKRKIPSSYFGLFLLILLMNYSNDFAYYFPFIALYFCKKTIVNIRLCSSKKLLIKICRHSFLLMAFIGLDINAGNYCLNLNLNCSHFIVSERASSMTVLSSTVMELALIAKSNIIFKEIRVKVIQKHLITCPVLCVF
jgi:hypothetical protein